MTFLISVSQLQTWVVGQQLDLSNLGVVRRDQFCEIGGGNGGLSP